jgi:AAA family ATP:ADP antiporter
VVLGAIGAYFAQNVDLDSTAAIEMILDTMLSQAGPDAVKARREAARLLGVIRPPSELHSRLHPLLNDADPEVVEQALLSAGKIREREFLPLVIGKLGQPRFVATARAALALYGKSAVGTLQSFLNDGAIPLAVRRQIPGVLARIPTVESGEALAHSLLQSDPGLRYGVLKALNKLRAIDPALLPADVDYADMVNLELMGYYRSFQILAAFDSLGQDGADSAPLHGSERLLRRAFRECMQKELELVFRLLALVYPPRDIHNAFVGLTSGRPRLRANALEVLEHLIQPDLYRRLANVLDPEVSAQRRLDVARQFCRTDVGSATDALRIVVYSEDVWMRACAIYTIGGLRLTELEPDLHRVPYDHDPLLEETTHWALARLAAATSP